MLWQPGPNERNLSHSPPVQFLRRHTGGKISECTALPTGEQEVIFQKYDAPEHRRAEPDGRNYSGRNCGTGFYDENGNQINVNHISSGASFGLELACSRQTASPIQLRAVTDCQVLFISFEAVLSVDLPPCPYRSRVASNLLRDFARQTLFLNQKLRILSQKRLRDKIKVYLQSQEIDENGQVRLPFSRNEMADFLYADRSALSRELSRMQQEGILTYHGQDFHILSPEFLTS